MSMSRCPICDHSDEFVYCPPGSLIDLRVFVCSNCGFVHTTRAKDPIAFASIAETHETLSSRADYSSGRVGKQQMTQDNIRLFDSELRNFHGPKVLDMSVARGHFLNYSEETLGASRIVGIEPDVALLEGVSLGSETVIYTEDYRELTLEEEFDIVYSCHTLEHYSNPLPNLRFIASHLAEGGVAVIDVPNMETLIEVPPLDEFFYDKHRSYFTKSTLVLALKLAGLRVRIDKSTKASIKFLVQKCETEFVDWPSLEEVCASRELVSQYVNQLQRNRESLPEAVRLICADIMDWDQTVVVGCGRILDAAVRYGQFPIGAAGYLVDSYLSTTGSQAFGRAIVTLEDVPCLENPEVILMTRTATEPLVELIHRWNSNSSVYILATSVGVVR